jgi:nucleoside-diphosphate-sugar epimerase
MRILVVGGAGYVGSRLVGALVGGGHAVEVVDLLWFGNSLPGEVRVRRANLFDLTVADVRGFDRIVLLAGVSNDPMADFSPRVTFRYNSAGAAFIGDLAKRAGVRRLVYASSCSVYGDSGDALCHEQSLAAPRYAYGISKLRGERALLRMSDARFSVVSLRQGTVSGFSPRMRLDLIVNTMFKTALDRSEIVVNSPSIWRPILAIEDACTAYLRAIAAPEGISGVFNVASCNQTVGETALAVGRQVEERLGRRVEVRVEHRTELRNYRVSTEAARHVLGFTPRCGVEDIVDDLAPNIDAFRDFGNPNYYNIEVFRRLAETNGDEGRDHRLERAAG